MDMRNLILYTAVTLDGYIARPDGAIDFLDSYNDVDYGYEAFMAGLDTVLMGHTTFKHIQGFPDWPYAAQKAYVFSRSPQAEDARVTFVQDDPDMFVRGLLAQPGKDVWLVGGGQLNAALIHLVDTLMLYLIPVTIGTGIPVLHGLPPQQHWAPTHSRTFANGVVELHYQKKPR